MTNLFYVSLAYKMAMLQLTLPEVNYVSRQLNLPTPHPIQMVDVTKAFVISPRMRKPGVTIDTTNFFFSFPNGKLYTVVNKEKHMERFDLYPIWANTPSLINSNGAHQLATQWLAAIDVDVGALEKKYGSQMKIEQAFFWNQPGLGFYHPPGDTNKTMLPIFNVTWGSNFNKTWGTNWVNYQAQVRILGTTKELMELTLGDSFLSRRPSLIITNAEELNNIPNPPMMRLEQPSQLQTNSAV